MAQFVTVNFGKKVDQLSMRQLHKAATAIHKTSIYQITADYLLPQTTCFFGGFRF